ncbi:MAG: hypothetical protein ABSF10_14535 [Verrucomicrobiota bacterium]|jgi:hypothetical protein
MANLEEVAKLVQDTYANVWRDWYAEHPGCVPATVTVDLNCTSAGYGHKFNLIIISFANGNLDDCDILNSEAWPIWKTDLIHEMLHEYERKILTKPSDAGRALFAAHPHPVWGPGHEEMFYTAICDKAPYFHFTPLELIGHI